MAQIKKSFQYTVFLKQQNLQFSITQNQRILDAAIIANIRFPVSCRNGSCRTCMCQIIEGKVHYNMDWPGLSKEEIQDGWILPCVAIADSDVVLEIGFAEKILKSS